MRTIHVGLFAAFLALPAATAANAQDARAPKAAYAQLSRSAEAPAPRQVVRQREAVRARAPISPPTCRNITCPGFILLGVAY